MVQSAFQAVRHVKLFCNAVSDGLGDLILATLFTPIFYQSNLMCVH